MSYKFLSSAVTALAYISLCMMIMFVVLMYTNNDLFIQILNEGPVAVFQSHINRQNNL